MKPYYGIASRYNTNKQACQQYISIAIYLFIAINIFIIALFSILQYIIAAKKLQYYCNILQKYVSIRVCRDIVGEVYMHI